MRRKILSTKRKISSKKRLNIKLDSSIRIYRFQHFEDRQFTNHNLNRGEKKRINLSLDLGLEELLQGNSISSELGDTLTQLLNSHSLLVEVEAEMNLVVEVLALRDVKRSSAGSVKLLGHSSSRVVQVLQQVGGDGQVVTASKLGDLTSVTERGTHDDGLVTVLLVVIEDILDGLDTGVLLGGVVALVGGLVPVEDTADEGGDQEGTSLGGGDGLDEGEHEGQVAVDAVLGLQDVGGLDTLVGGGNLDQDTVLGDTVGFVQLEGNC